MKMGDWFDHIDMFGIGIIIFAFIGINTSLNKLTGFIKQSNASKHEKQR